MLSIWPKNANVSQIAVLRGRLGYYSEVPVTSEKDRLMAAWLFSAVKLELRATARPSGRLHVYFIASKSGDSILHQSRPW